MTDDLRRAEEQALAALREAALRAYGPERVSQLRERLGDIGHWIALINQQTLELLDEEPDSDGR